MKTQLLEDIGQSATLSLVPSDRVANSGSYKAGQDIAQAPVDAPVRSRSAFGVWRRKPDDEPVVPATQQPEPPLPAAPPAFEPIAAVETQHVPPQLVHEAVITPAEPTLGANATQSESAPHGPVFDFTFPSPATSAVPDLLTRETSWFERSGQRYLLWGACVLAGALVIQGGRWLYQQSKDAGVLALVADEVKAEPQLDKAAKRRAMGAKEFTLGPDGEVQAAPASSTSPRPHPAPTLPPLVLLKPEPAAAAKVIPAATLEADREAVRAPHKLERVAEQAPAAPLPKEIHRTAAAKPARARVERAPDRPIEREPVMQVAKKSEPESAMSAMSATLKACKEHGYHPAQCVAHKCSVTKYGFVCRGT
jgi:hypothetical protein